jgi:transposase-like protein
MKCLGKDKAQMLAFYDFPAIHWQHIRTSNPIESTFATVTNFTPSMTSARSLKPLSLFQRFSALCANLNTMDNMVARETAFLVLTVLSLTVAKVDSKV